MKRGEEAEESAHVSGQDRPERRPSDDENVAVLVPTLHDVLYELVFSDRAFWIVRLRGQYWSNSC